MKKQVQAVIKTISFNPKEMKVIKTYLRKNKIVNFSGFVKDSLALKVSGMRAK